MILSFNAFYTNFVTLSKPYNYLLKDTEQI